MPEHEIGKRQIGGGDVPLDFYMEVSKGNIPGHRIATIIGSAQDINAAWKPVAGAKVYRTPTTLTELEILSDDVDDGPAGSGLRSVIVDGIGPDWLEVQEVVNLNGTTPVALANGYFRLHQVRSIVGGTYATVESPTSSSTITIRESGAGETWGIMSEEQGLGIGTSEISCFTIPKDKIGFMLKRQYEIESTKAMTLAFGVRFSADAVAGPFGALALLDPIRELETGLTSLVFPIGPIEGPTDIIPMARIAQSTGDLSITYQILLVDKEAV